MESTLCGIIKLVIYMKVLTLKQPWASLVAEGIKEYEFNYRGKILIHAGVGVDKNDMKRFNKLNLNFSSKKNNSRSIIS